MRAVVLEGGQKVALGQVADPRVTQPGRVVIQVSLAAICGTDVHIIDRGVAAGPLVRQVSRVPGFHHAELRGHVHVRRGALHVAHGPRRSARRTGARPQRRPGAQPHPRLRLGRTALLAVDMFDNRLAIAKQFGAEVIDLRAGAPVAQVLAANDGQGVDVALDATGNTQALLSAAQTIRRYGTISCVGLFARPAEFLAHEVIYRGIKLVMGLGNLVHVPKLTKLLEFGRVALTPVGTHVFSLDDAVVAYDLFENHKDQCLKVFLKP